MHRILLFLLIGTLAACGSGSSSKGGSTPPPTPTPDTRVLDEHACLEGTWLAVSRNLKIGEAEYPVSTDRVFLVVSGQTNVSTPDEIANGQTSYVGSGLRTWYTKNNFTEDIHAGSWLASFDDESPEANGALAIQDACRHVYSGDVIDTNLPQCHSSMLFNRNTQLTLNCSGDVGILTMENARTSINFQRVSENEDIIAFTRDDDDSEAVDLDAAPPIPVDVLDEDEIEEIIRDHYGDDETSEEEIEEILEDILEDIHDDEEETPSQQNDTNPLSPELDPNDIDTDGDGVPDHLDAFPFNSNENTDTDGDGIGNNTDTDDDNDTEPDPTDDFPLDPTEQTDTDNDGTGNNADTDDDNDGTQDNNDEFPLDESEDTDTDGDGIGNNADTDDDNDGTPDTADAFPLDETEDTDSDNDSIGNNADEDNDQVPDTLDMFPLNPEEWMDSDGDGLGNNEDTDDDNDGLSDLAERILGTNELNADSDGDFVIDGLDAFPLDHTEHSDSDGDGIGDNADAFPYDANESLDSDGDGVGDNADAFPFDASETLDSDGDGVGDNADAFPFDASESKDSDGDGVGDNADAFPFDPNRSEPDPIDTDGDGVPDELDAFPYDPNETLDSDGDGVGDNADAFPFDATESKDSDGDGVGDNADAFPLDATESKDSDGDGVGDNADAFPFDPTRSEPDPEPEPEPEDPSIAKQDWQSFYTGQDWYLTDFDLPENATRADYVTEDGEILFDIRWTRRTRNHLADLLGYDREEMTHELANMLCPPMIEVGKASVYSAGDSENMIAELDSDLYHCNINGDEPANVRIRSFIPTKVGYIYKATAQYRMRSYAGMPNNAYRHFVMRFGKTAIHHAPVFDQWSEASIEIVARHKFSKLVLRDNGLPDSYGILVDDIQIEEVGPVAHYDECAALFDESSKAFRKCISGEIDIEQGCTMDNFQIDLHAGHGASDDDELNDAFSQDGSSHLSLGKKGMLRTSCFIDGQPTAFPLFNQRLSFHEYSQEDENSENNPELARVWVRLNQCDDDRMNGTKHLGLISTHENFSYEFTENDEGISYAGCHLDQLTIQDKTPQTSPSNNGFDLKGLLFQGL